MRRDANKFTTSSSALSTSVIAPTILMIKRLLLPLTLSFGEFRSKVTVTLYVSFKCWSNRNSNVGTENMLNCSRVDTGYAEMLPAGNRVGKLGDRDGGKTKSKFWPVFGIEYFSFVSCGTKDAVASVLKV